MRPLALLAALLMPACSTPVAQQQANLCPAPSCAPGAASLGAQCGAALDGVCSADGACLPPCGARVDCASLGPAAGACESPVCDAVSGACSYMRVDVAGCGAP